MTAIALLDFHLDLNSDDLSTQISKATLNVKAEALESTTFGGSGYRSRIGGLKDYSLALEFNQSFTTGELDSFLFPLLGTVILFAGRPTSAAVGPNNPEYSGSVLVEEYTPVDSTVGDLAKVSVTWSAAGPLTRAVS